jgi:hypothetical protein
VARPDPDRPYSQVCCDLGHFDSRGRAGANTAFGLRVDGNERESRALVVDSRLDDPAGVGRWDRCRGSLIAKQRRNPETLAGSVRLARCR